ncbi:uncharacterized protein LOC105254002 [Camponotus floridanus]|uniref:uncharacterized protein LOC105254002 n=1 Tax=Camponotus floridanus TaxID=104421 RepID=UPI00059E41B3|nr:uncharacterized protein LOC105254002 [Camponotus floridanus]
MNESKIMTIILRRMFSKKYFKPLAGIRSRMQLIKQDEQNVDIENFDNEDLSEFEADFMNVGESHKIHEREMRKNKEHLKQQIVNQKYFIENEPRFLTFAERQLICKLYKSNPEEWTVEKLSESFPALPETIRKIVHANWMPKSVERIMQYDDVAIENWKKFHTGKLPVSPRFNEHLKKFKNRKIILTDRELLAKQFVVPKPKFGKPKSQLFSNIIQSYASEKQNNEKLLQENNSHKMKDAFIHSNENQNLLIADNKTENNSIDVKNPKKFMLKEEQHLTLNSDTESKKHDIFNKKNNSEKLFTFDEFVKTKLEDIHKKSPKEGITLLNLYRKQMDASEEIKTASNDAIINTEKGSLEIVQKSDQSVSEISKNTDNNIVIADNLVDTSIKIWSKKIDAECDYAKPIKISENLYKPGMTYRINDCYYDDDGEFLYRIPGVQS